MNEIYDSYLKIVKDFILCKSVSTDQKYQADIDATVNFLNLLFAEYGFETRLLKGSNSNPVVYASYVVSDSAQTVLVYGHYDVQPAEGWSSDPFVVREEDGRLMARGIVDNKGQIAIHIAAVFELIKAKRLKYNVKFLIEGNEETANPDMSELVRVHQDLLKCDQILISDGEMIGEHPVQEVSLRGGANVKLTVTTAKNDLHSGIYGSAVPNAVHELCKFLDLLHQQEQIAIPGWYDKVTAATKEQKENNESLPFSMTELANSTGIKELKCEEDVDFYTQTGLRPSVQVTGINGGYIGEGYANIVPASAEARINFRFVAEQDPEELLKIFESYIKTQLPEYVSWSLERTDSYKPVAIDVTTPFMQEVKELLEQVYGKKVLYKNVGGSIPVVVDFKEILGVDACLVPLGNEDCNMHGKDENFRIDLIKKGLNFSQQFFS